MNMKKLLAFAMAASLSVAVFAEEADDDDDEDAEIVETELETLMPRKQVGIWPAYFAIAEIPATDQAPDVIGLRVTIPFSTSTSAMRPPNAFTSSALREQKCSSRRCNCAGQAGLTHRVATSPSNRSTAPPQTGQTVGISKTFSAPVRFSVMTESIAGMTSPALTSQTWSPIRMS